MAPLPDYVTGTITLTNGSPNFTGDGTGWLAAGFREGDTILGIEDNEGVVYVIESITDNDAGTLTQDWQGATGTYAYRMRYLSDGQRVTAQARQLIELLGNGNLQAVAGLPGTPQTLMMFTGPGAMVEVPRTDLVSGAAYDVQVDTLADRDAYDSADAGFAVLVSDVGDGRAAIYSKLSNTTGDWSDPAYVTGPAVTLDVGSVTPVAFGNDPDVTLTPVAGGYEFDFELPENATFQSGTITTLDPGEDATFSLSPVPGGYALNLGVPRGPTGDIDGVTGFWQGRITVDTTAEQALAGLGAVGGPLSSTDDRIAVFDGTTGKLLKDGGVTVSELVPADGSITNAKLANMAQATVKGRASGAGTGVPVDLSAAQLLAIAKAAGAYAMDNILGTVSESSGVPTGAIIERGSNANGEYVKWADGTMICAATLSTSFAVTTASGSLFVGATGALDFPAAFIEPPNVSRFVHRQGGGASAFAASAADNDVTATTVRVGGYAGVSSPTVRPGYIAIGRWF